MFFRFKEEENGKKFKDISRINEKFTIKRPAEGIIYDKNVNFYTVIVSATRLTRFVKEKVYCFFYTEIYQFFSFWNTPYYRKLTN